MPRKNPSFENQTEFNELMSRYEGHLENHSNIYLDADQLADIADQYAESMEFDKAQEAIDYGLRLHPGNTDLLIEQSLLYLDTNRLSEAIEVAESINENTEEVILLRGELLLNEDKPEEAEVLFQNIKDFENIDLLADIASLYHDTGFPEYALQWIEETLEHFPENEELLLMKAESHADLSQFETAIEIYNRLIDADPFNANYWIDLAQCYLSVPDYNQVLNAADFALAANEELGEAYLLRGHALLNLERNDEAIIAFQRAIQYKGVSPILGNMFLALTYSSQERWEEAVETFQASIDSIPDEFDILRIDLYLNQIKALIPLKRYEEALHVCALAKELSPKSSDIYLTEGYVHHLCDNIDLAHEAWKTAIEYAPEAETWLKISEYLVEFRLLKEVLYCLEEALKLDARLEGIHPRLAVTYLLLGDQEGYERHNALSPSPIPREELLDFINKFNEQDEPQDFWKLIDKWRQDKE